MRRSVLAIGAALFVVAVLQRGVNAQLLCEQYPGCETYPGSSSISDGDGSGDSGGMGFDPMDGSNNQVAPDFAVNEQFGSFGGDSFVSTNSPSMIGDLLAPRIRLFNVPVASPSGTTRYKFADNQSPLPRNRIFYNFSHFHNAVEDGATGTDFNISRHVFGIERTVLGDIASVELRIPFADTLGAEQVSGGSFINAVEFGDIGVAGKVLLINRQLLRVSAGIVTSLPTAPDIVVQQGNQSAVLETDSYRAGPFLGFVFTPGSRLVIQSVLQVDMDVNGSDFVDPVSGATGTFQDQNLFMATMSVAYWVRQNNFNAMFTDVAGILELHYTTSTGDGDFIPLNPGSTDRYSSPLSTEGVSTSILNLTAGCELRMGQQNSIVIGAGVPLRGDRPQDELFSTEVLFQYNRFY